MSNRGVSISLLEMWPIPILGFSDSGTTEKTIHRNSVSNYGLLLGFFYSHSESLGVQLCPSFPKYASLPDFSYIENTNIPNCN